MLAQEFYGNALWVWALAVGIAAGVTALLWVARKLGMRALARERAGVGFLMQILQKLVGRTKLWFLVVVGIYAGALALALPDAMHRAVELVVMLGFLLQLAFWGSGLIAFWLARYTKRMMQAWTWRKERKHEDLRYCRV